MRVYASTVMVGYEGTMRVWSINSQAASLEIRSRGMGIAAFVVDKNSRYRLVEINAGGEPDQEYWIGDIPCDLLRA